MIQCVYQHADFYIVNKPAGESFHSETATGFFAKCEQHFNEKLFPVHRLDKVTSGLLIVARNQDAASFFGDAFASHNMNKWYLALSDNKPKKKQGWVVGDMAKSRRGSYKLLKSKENPARTRFYTTSLGQGLRAFLLKPYSGKTHQLRVAMKSLGAPILGDERYAGRVAARTFLHALALSFDYHGDQVQLTALPDDTDFLTHLTDLPSDFKTPWLYAW